jgi:hypothetical protein
MSADFLQAAKAGDLKAVVPLAISRALGSQPWRRLRVFASGGFVALFVAAIAKLLAAGPFTSRDNRPSL